MRKDQLHYWRSLHKWVVYLKILILENLFYVSQECCDQNTPSNSPTAPGTKLKFGKERVHREVLSKSAHLMSLRAKSRGQITWGDLDSRTMRPRSSTGLGENIYKLKNSRKATFYVPGDVKGMSTPIASKRPEEREFVVDSGASKHMMSKKRIKLRRIMENNKVQKPKRSVDWKRRSAHPRGGTSVRSWLESLRNRATTRRNASCPIARQALQRPRILPWVGQRSRATIDQKWEKYYLQDRQFCTSCRSRVICQFRHQFVFCYAIPRIDGTRGISSLWKQSGRKLFFRFSIGGKWRTSHREGNLGRNLWEVTRRTKMIR